VAQGAGAGPCRRSAEGGRRPLNWESLTGGAAAILGIPDPAAKAGWSRALHEAWRAGAIDVADVPPPLRPARPERPRLLPPRMMPRRRNLGSLGGRIALLHALAHIELNAIDLGWDIVARFRGEPLPREFFADWAGVAADEARHFEWLLARLAELGVRYGDLPAHDGLWQAAAATADDLIARLAVVPLVLEARGLDVTPPMAARLERAGDRQSAELLRRILAEEVGHVAIGVRWLERVCRRRGVDAAVAFREAVRRCFKGDLKPPFNREARAAAGFPAHYWEPLASALRSG
jgi:uncharacterized ferritin-like protein (DUF455 family)